MEVITRAVVSLFLGALAYPIVLGLINILIMPFTKTKELKKLVKMEGL